MATYKSSAGAILEPGNQVNRLSSYNDEGVFGWPGLEAFELIGFAKVTNLEADKSSNKSFDLTVPSPDRRPDDRVRDDRTTLVVKASSDRPAYVYGASIGIAQDLPAGGLATFPASPVTAGLGGTTGELLLLGPANGAVPFGVPTAQLNGLAAATSTITAASSAFAEGARDTTVADIPFWTTVTSTIARADAANSMMFKVTADTHLKCLTSMQLLIHQLVVMVYLFLRMILMQVEQDTSSVELTIYVLRREYLGTTFSVSLTSHLK